MKLLSFMLCLTLFVRGSFGHKKVHGSLASFLSVSERARHEGAQKRFMKGFFCESCHDPEALQQVKNQIVSHIKRAWSYYNGFLLMDAPEEVVHNHFERHSFFKGV